MALSCFMSQESPGRCGELLGESLDRGHIPPDGYRVAIYLLSAISPGEGLDIQFPKCNGHGGWRDTMYLRDNCMVDAMEWDCLA